MVPLNATNLFDRSSFPHNSEPFWTATFSYFLLHLGGLPEGNLRVWQSKESTKLPYWKPHSFTPELCLGNLSFDDIAVEPSSLLGNHFDGKLTLSPTIGGFRPDLFVRLRKPSAEAPCFLIIENKTIGAEIYASQQENYLGLMKTLEEGRVTTQFLLLTSVGMDTKRYEVVGHFQNILRNRFGVLLWEDIIRQMIAAGFSLPGVDPHRWHKYSDSFDQEVDLS